MEKICVAVRMRPPTREEEASCGTHWKWKVENNRVSLHRLLGTPLVSFPFDHVFDENSSNSTIYELVTKDIIHAVVEGFNGTAFVYGQTSSGKTFTMNGSDTDPGIIHRAVGAVFNKIDMVSDREFLIRVSYMEIYNEEINDLLSIQSQKLQIRESLERGIFVAGLTEEIASNAKQVLDLFQLGEVNRHFGETSMNARSSRSHTIFRMVIESKGKDTNAKSVRVSVLNLVDLAGSERIAKTGAGGAHLKEGTYINRSLMVLGNVINKLSKSGTQRGHIPYRDSKLTRILQPALGGNAKTLIICTIAPEEIHVKETKGTLQFASKSKQITNCAQVNEILTDSALLERQKLEIEELRKKLQGSRAEALEQEMLKLRSEMSLMQVEIDTLRKQLDICLQCLAEKENWERHVSDLASGLQDERSSRATNGGLQQIQLPLAGDTSVASNDQMDLKTMVDTIAAARQREAEAHQRVFTLPKENDDVQLKLRAYAEDNKTLLAKLKEAIEEQNSIIQLYEQAACASKSRDMSTSEKDEMSDMDVELPEIAESKESEMEIAVENLGHELQEMHEENEKLMVLYEQAMLERDAYKKMLSSAERSRTDTRGQRGCGEKLIIDEGRHNECCSGSEASTSNEQQQQHMQPLQCPRCWSYNTRISHKNPKNPDRPRCFCGACRRYWSQGAKQRYIPKGEKLDMCTRCSAAAAPSHR